MSLIDDAFEAFLGAEALSCEHGEEAEFFPFGDRQESISLTGVIVNRDGLLGTNEQPGDGRGLERTDERSERRSLTLDIPARYCIPEIVDRPNSATLPHLILVPGEGLFTIKKLMSRDTSFDTYLVAAKDVSALRKPSRSG